MDFSELMDAYKINSDLCNKNTYDSLVLQLRTNRVTPIIGAGLSCWAGYPLWQSLLEEKAKGIPLKTRNEITARLAEYKFEEAASLLEKFYKHNAFISSIESAFSPDKIDEDKRPKYQLKIPKLFKGAIVTTNYDVALESLLKAPLIITPESTYQKKELTSRIQKNQQVIVKLHGTILNPEHIILTNERYSETYGRDEFQPDISLPIPAALREIFTAAPPLFLGCGLVNDRTCAVLRACKGATGFALMELPEETENSADPLHPILMNEYGFIAEFENRQKELDDLELKVIWYPHGMHEAVGVFIDQLYNDLYGKPESISKTEATVDSTAISKKISVFIEERKRKTQSFGLLPVMNTGIAFKNAFPRLFVRPTLSYGREKIGYEDLLDLYTRRNVVILGEAGSGKSTLLKYISQFEKTNAVYFTTQDIKEHEDILKNIQILCKAEPSTDLFLLIDGLDEVYWNDMESYHELIVKLLDLNDNVHCWLASRKEFYQRTYSEGTRFTEYILEIDPWEENIHTKKFLKSWADIFEQERVPDIVDSWTKDSVAAKEMLGNPFQLTLLAYLAGFSDDNDTINTTYDLYERFFRMWFKNEKNRSTGSSDWLENIRVLEAAAQITYRGAFFHTHPLDNSAVTDLLIWQEESDMEGKRVATMFRHNSLAAFILAHQLLDAMKKGDKELLDNALNQVIKDDVTNFVIRKAEWMSEEEISLMRLNLSQYYNLIPNDDRLTNIREKVIYYMSRFKGDSSNFLLPIVNQKPSDPHMRLSLAYACSLAEDKTLRRYALKYAESLSRNGDDARVNRAWTVVYFGDSNENPYTYRDESLGPWKNAREARLKRFSKANPRLKDYRFFLFDLPLFHTFLITRNWNDINRDEYNIIFKLCFSKDAYYPEEIRFLEKEKKSLLVDYNSNLLIQQLVSNGIEIIDFNFDSLVFEGELEFVFGFRFIEDRTEYAVFSDNKADSNGYVDLFASRIVRDSNNLKAERIDDTDELKRVEKVLKIFADSIFGCD
jgi:ABC-type oligopeptide transport system ATPase subunit